MCFPVLLPCAARGLGCSTGTNTRGGRRSDTSHDPSEQCTFERFRELLHANDEVRMDWVAHPPLQVSVSPVDGVLVPVAICSMRRQIGLTRPSWAVEGPADHWCVGSASSPPQLQ